MNSKQKSTLKAIFETPTRSNILWNDKSLLRALGAEVSEGKGSRVRLYLGGVRAVFHRPHPEKITDKGAVVSMRTFLRNVGVDANAGI